MSWSNIIGHVQYAAPISIDQGKMGYTSDWAIFEAAEEKLKAKFEGNIVDLGSKYTPQVLSDVFYPVPGG
ncbi:hypothetical protein H2248_003408 [Termitomyces sp. 'cryptogamus']|nr:hypothetical protein H2248_003408 [Termitomyces sp. 'cryptogamus']